MNCDFKLACMNQFSKHLTRYSLTSFYLNPCNVGISPAAKHFADSSDKNFPIWCDLSDTLHPSIVRKGGNEMPPKKRFSHISQKRTATTSTSHSPIKKPRINASQYKDSKVEEDHGIVQREFYPSEMTNERAYEYRDGHLERPIESLKKAAKETHDAREQIPVKDVVVHWFKCDLRTRDNTALHMASEKAKSKGVPLVAVYLVSLQDYQAHFTSAVRVDFILRTLNVLQADLAQLDIPLHVETIDKRKKLPRRLIGLCQLWGANHLFANVEYEVDELRREANLTRQCLESGIAFNTFEDTCVVNPYSLSSLSGGQFAVYSPWYRAWLKYLNEKPEKLEEYAQPAANPPQTREKLKNEFDCDIPQAPPNKRLTDEERKRFSKMWPAGEGEAHARLQKFLTTKAQGYKENRNLPAGNNTSVLSVHLAAGTLAARTCVREAHKANNSSKLDYLYAKKLDQGHIGYISWIAELAWRDFYRHVMCHCPWVV